MKSDADPELLFTVPFTRVVRMHSIEVRAPKGTGPKTIKLFAGRQIRRRFYATISLSLAPSLSLVLILSLGQRGFNFDDAHTYRATQTLKLSASDLDGKRIELQYKFASFICTFLSADKFPQKLSNFQKLDCLTIFVEANQTDDDVTSLLSISLFGSVHGITTSLSTFLLCFDDFFALSKG